MNNLKHLFKKYWKKLLLGLLIFVLIYTKYTSMRVIREIKDFNNNNDFLHYSLTEYIVYFSNNGYESGYLTGTDYLISNNGLYLDPKYYSNNCFGVYGRKDGGFVRLDYSEDINANKDVFPNAVFRIKEVNDVALPLVYGIEWDDTYKDVKRKIGLNVFNTSLPWLRYINETIKCTNSRIGIHSSKLDYDYDLYFDDNGKLEEIIIWSNNSKQQ